MSGGGRNPSQEQVFTGSNLVIATMHRNIRQNFAKEHIYAQLCTPVKVAHIERSKISTLIELLEESGIIKLEAILDGIVTQSTFHSSM